MISVFTAITSVGVGNPAALAGGIAQAPITTPAADRAREQEGGHRHRSPGRFGDPRRGEPAAQRRWPTDAHRDAERSQAGPAAHGAAQTTQGRQCGARSAAC